MPRCHFCGTSYSYGGWSGPPEDCECGENCSEEGARELGEEEYGQARMRSNAAVRAVHLTDEEAAAEEAAKDRAEMEADARAEQELAEAEAEAFERWKNSGE